MRLTDEPLWRSFWYPTVAVAALRDGPRPFRLLGTDLVLFLDAHGTPAALRDRCRHRTARLSKGTLAEGGIACPYHGWTYAGDGRLVRVPQLPPDAPLPASGVEAFRCQARYGLVFVALAEPSRPLIDLPEDIDPTFRRISQFDEEWRTSPLRLMENSFDNAHFAFVHKGTFGDMARPKPGRYAIEETDGGFYAEAVTGALNPPAAHRVTGCTTPTIERTLRSRWHLPFTRRFDMEFSSGIRHVIVTFATPIEDARIKVIQILYRNDTEADCPARLLVEWDAAIIAEDKEILEATDPNVPLDVGSRLEAHMPSDRPGLIMRRQLLALLAARDGASGPSFAPARELRA